jgi:UDP-glucuronate 4-epimerase
MHANLICSSFAFECLFCLEVIEKNIGRTAEKKMMPMQPGDVPSTVADISKLRALGWAPTIRIDVGIKNFVEWYRAYYRV